MRKFLFLFLLFLFLPFSVYAGGGVSGVEYPAAVNSVTEPDKVCGVEGLAGASTENLGYDTAGTGGSSSPGSNLLYITASDTAGMSGSVNSIWWYISCSASQTDVEFGLYDGATYSTATLVASEVTVNDIGTLSEGWHEFDVSGGSWTVTSGHTYWIGYCTNNGSAITRWYDSGTSWYQSKTFGSSWPDPYGSGSSTSSIYSIYAVIE